MPKCVVKTVRAWLPKTDQEHYVGHLWKNNKYIQLAIHVVFIVYKYPMVY